MQQNTTEIFRDAPVPKAVLSNVIPSIISMIMVLIYNLADTFFIGQTKNALMVAAVSVATPAFLLFMAVGMLFGIGGTSFISRMLGEGQEERAKHASAFCFWTGLAVGIISMILIVIFAEPVCKAIGASPDTIEYATQYLRIVAIGIPFLIISNAFSNIIRSEGRAKTAMSGMIIGNILSAVFYVSHLLSKKSQLSIRLQDYKAGDKIAGSVFAIGIPASLNSVLMSVSNIFINNLMAHYGDMAVAGLGVAMKVNMIVVMLLIGLGTGIQPLLGYCFGAGNRKRYFAVLKFSILLAFVLSAIMTCVCYFGADGLVSAFLEDADAYDFGFQFSRIYILSGPILGQLFVFINAIQSTGAALPSLILSISRQGLLYLPILFIINATTDSARLLALAQPVTDYLATALAIILFVITCKKYFPKKSSIE